MERERQHEKQKEKNILMKRNRTKTELYVSNFLDLLGSARRSQGSRKNETPIYIFGRKINKYFI